MISYACLVIVNLKIRNLRALKILKYFISIDIFLSEAYHINNTNVNLQIGQESFFNIQNYKNLHHWIWNDRISKFSIKKLGSYLKKVVEVDDGSAKKKSWI